MKLKLVYIIVILVVLFPKVINNQIEDKNSTTGLVEPNLVVVEVNQTTIFTAYTLSIDETDGNPCIGAGNHNLCEYKGLVCATNLYPLHSQLYIEGFGICEVLDRMNKRYTNRIDILMDSKEKAKEFGIRKLTYVKL